MMCAAASRPTMMGAAREVMAAAGPRGFLAGIGARALSNGINSAVFFCFFEAIRTSLQQQQAALAGAGEDTNLVAAWAAQARERVAGIPRALSSLSLALPLALPGSRPQRQLQWATAGAGGDWLGGGGGHAEAAAPAALSLALPLGGGGGGGGEAEQLLLLADAGCGVRLEVGVHGDSSSSGGADGAHALPPFPAAARRLGGGGGGGGGRRAGVSLSLLARASPLRLEHHSQIAMAVAALKGVEAGPLEDE
jgi:hypothetical protein